MSKYYVPQIDKSSLEGTSEDACRLLKNILQADAHSAVGKIMISERQIALKLGLDRTSVHRIYLKLIDDGVLERLTGGRLYKITSKIIASSYNCIGIVLPMRFSEYIHATTYQQQRQRYYNGIVDRASDLGFATKPIYLPPANTPISDIKAFLAQELPKLTGLIHLGDRGLEYDPALRELLIQNQLPQIFINSSVDNPQIGSISYDHTSVINAISHFLKDRGHHNLAIVSPQYSDVYYCQYTMIYLKEMAELFRHAGMNVKKTWEIKFPDNPTIKFLEEKIIKLLKEPDLPTAFWCRNDKTALKLIEIIQNLGYQVPQDFSVIGFDNILEGEKSTPRLTTLQNPIYACGNASVDMILEHKKNGVNDQNRKKTFPVTLIARDSVRVLNQENDFLNSKIRIF
jgi:DNA-binding LacI/PurR family transcriptional regulator